MSANSLCVRCATPLTAATPDGLCPTCHGRRDTTHADRTVLKTIPYKPSDETLSHDPAAPPWKLSTTVLPDAPEGYRIDRSLGPGGMGVVYRAFEEATGRQVAIKFPAQLAHDDIRERFRVEVQSLANLKHPNFVTVYSVVLERLQPYFTMELADGGTLSHRVREDGPPPFAETARILESAARAMHVAHRAGVIHRDLKPSNILLFSPVPRPAAPTWTDWVPKVSDFGLAKRLFDADGLTGTEQALGTPGYMPPEQLAAGSAAPHATADVYALGATLFDLLTGQPPFRSRGMKAFSEIRKSPPPLPRSLNPAVPPGLETICLKCLEKRPENRYQSAEELADDLARWRAGEAVTAQPVGRARRLWWSAKRRPAVAAAAAIVALAIAGIAAVPYLGAAPQPAAPAEKTPADVLADIHAEVNAGQRVTLLGETGGPRLPLVWDIAGPTPIVGDDHPLTFEAFDLALLQLLPEPGADRYRVRADLRLLASARGSGDFPLDCVGLYVGYTRVPDPDTTVVRHLIQSVSFNDYVSAKYKAAQRAANLQPFGYVRAAGQLIVEDKATAAKTFGPSQCYPRQLRYVPVEQFPGEWRRLQVDVSPDELVASWTDIPAGTTTEFSRVTRVAIAERYAELCQGRSPKLAWLPRRPLGIWCQGARIAIKDVCVEKLP